MGIAERKIKQRETVRRSILEASWKIVEQEGWQALSIRRIAEAIEYSIPVVYDHFANKEAILLEFTRQGYGSLNQYMQEAKDSSSEPAAQIEAMAYAYWKFAFENNEYYQLMYGLGMPTCETVRQIRELHSFTEFVQSSILQVMTAAGNPDADSFLKLHTFWSMLHGLVSINMLNHQGSNEQELPKKILRDFIRGFLISLKT